MELAHAPSGDAGIDELGEATTYCAYCGAPLNGRFYFCAACSTPYKHPETVLPTVEPAYVSDGTLIARRAPSALRVFWTYFAVVLGSAIIDETAFHADDLGARLIFGTVAIGLTTCIVAAIYWRSLAVQLKRVGFASPSAWIGLAALAPLLGINYLYQMRFLHWAGAQFAPLGDPNWSQWGLITVFCLLPAVSEELAFRGLLQHWLQAALTPARAVVIASALFAAMHFSILSFPYLFLVGLVLGWTKWKTQSLYPSMLIHFLHNLIVIELMTTLR